MTYSKKDNFDQNSQKIAMICKALSHPARIAILKYLAEQKTCVSGDITSEIPLSRTTVSQHLQELKNCGIIHGEISGTKVNYCLCNEHVKEVKSLLDNFIKIIDIGPTNCKL
ncbi:MAG: transcriptional regulator [Bacteroidetes bacterium GWF2_38_335]|nr:MAG: transcriptional regulator [Bacteroidetes bacterium GWF2_38_335]OFY80831.1 MAG: transcriptional regulator [Bacteroidetes bacterium RIFOXYA12_FULL_38_20]HBS86233.1 ArsR family transcriptional regulator [Bacteroidales bacterium]